MGDVSGQKQPAVWEEEARHRQGCWGKAVPVTRPWQRKVKNKGKSNRGSFP